jgi:hypothetical protein
MTPFRGELLLIAIGFVLGYFASPYLRGPASYEECLLKAVKGQKEFFYPTASRYCIKKFPLPAKVSSIAPAEEKFVPNPNAVDLSSYGRPLYPDPKQRPVDLSSFGTPVE